MSDIQTEITPDPFAPVMPTGNAPAQIASFDGIFIHPEKLLPPLDRGTVKAYAASGMADVSQITHYALICEPHLTPNVQWASAMSTINNTALVKLVAHGVVYWPPAKSERYVFVYEIPVGRPMMAEGAFTGLQLKPDLILGPILNSIAPALADLHDAGIVHGNIRPSTLYSVGTTSLERVILSECLAVPTAYSQPAQFMPIELAMASPIGRGPTRPACDMYALGVSLAIMARSRDPMEGMTDDEIIRHRMEIGSLAAYTGKDRISGNLIELFRGLLNDDPVQRWTIQDLMAWLDGQHLSTRQGLKKVKAARPLSFEEGRYYRPQILAMDLNKNQAAAAQMVETRELELWISRSLEDALLLKRLESAIDTAGQMGHGPGYWDRLLSLVSIALDPDAPLRYKGISAFPDAVGASLTHAMVMKSDLQPFVDMFNNQIPTFWATSQPGDHVDIGYIVTRFDNCRAFLRQNNIAYGLERCLYFLNPNCQCLSEKLRGFYVRTPEDMMRAFEKISSQPGRPELFFDRHSIAFMSVKDRKDVDSFLIELNADEPYKRIMGNIKTLATIQQRSRMDRFPGICRWISEILDPVYVRFHDRELRTKLKARVDSLVETGDISKIAGLLSNQQTLAYDIDGYNQARMEYYQLSLEGATLEKKMANPSMFGKGIGREVAALVSCILSGIAILFFVFMLFSKGSVF